MTDKTLVERLQTAETDIEAGKWRQADYFAELFNESTARIEELEAEIGRLRAALSWLCSEVERDHELGRLSVDSEDCAKAAREALGGSDG